MARSWFNGFNHVQLVHLPASVAPRSRNENCGILGPTYRMRICTLTRLPGVSVGFRASGTLVYMISILILLKRV